MADGEIGHADFTRKVPISAEEWERKYGVSSAPHEEQSDEQEEKPEPCQYSPDPLLNEAATAVAAEDEIHRLLNEGLHLAVDIEAVQRRTDVALEALEEDRRLEAIQLARGALF